MESEVGFPSSIIPSASGDPIAVQDNRRRIVSDALYSEGSFVDNHTWHAESSIFRQSTEARPAASSTRGHRRLE